MGFWRCITLVRSLAVVAEHFLYAIERGFGTDEDVEYIRHLQDGPKHQGDVHRECADIAGVDQRKGEKLAAKQQDA